MKKAFISPETTPRYGQNNYKIPFFWSLKQPHVIENEHSDNYFIVISDGNNAYVQMIDAFITYYTKET